MDSEGSQEVPRLGGVHAIGVVFLFTWWSRAQGCTEFASDTESDNTPSRLAHRALGFEEVGVVRCFRKGL